MRTAALRSLLRGGAKTFWLVCSSTFLRISQEEWKASLKELLAWSGGSERSRLSAQRHNAALQEAMQR